MVALLVLFLTYIFFNSRSNDLNITNTLIKEDKNNYFDSEWEYIENRKTIIPLPKIIQNLYNSIENNNSEEFYSSSNVIRCIHVANYKITRSGMIIRFNLTTIHHQEQVINSKIYIFKYGSSLETSYIIRLYRVISKNQSDDFQELIEIAYISSNFQGYLALNLEKSLEKWKSHTFTEFLISITDSRDRKIILKDTGFDIKTNNPILVAYLFTKDDKVENSLNLAPIQNGNHAITNSTCQLTSLNVNFTQSHFANFILYPKSVNLFKCTGYCNLLEADYTNNAMFTEIYLKRSKHVTCCIPNQYKSILIMFLDKLNNIVIKNYKDMIVTSCKCR